MLATVIGIVGSFLAEIVGGVIAYQIAEGQRGSRASLGVAPIQRTIIEHHTVIEIREQGPAAGLSDEDTVATLLGFSLVVVVIVVIAVGALAAMVTQWGPFVAVGAQIASLVLGGLAGLALLLSVWDAASSPSPQRARTCIYVIVMCFAFFLMSWLLELPLNPPEGWMEVQEALRAVQIGAESWTTRVFEIAWDSPRASLFFALQAVGVLLGFLGMLIIVYLVLDLFLGLSGNEDAEFEPPALALFVATVLALGASFFLGLGWPVVEWMLFS